MIDIVGKRLWFLLVLWVVIVFGIISLVRFGLKPGIEFSSGSVLTIKFEQTVAESDLKQEVIGTGHTEAIIQQTGEGTFLIRTRELTGEEKTALESALTARFGALTETEFDSVSPLVATETTRNTVIAVGIACVGMVLYIALAFRKMPNPFRCGICAVICLVHDILIPLGVFSILGHILGWQINLMFITGILAVLGYAINNNVVVFDRIRENLRKGISRVACPKCGSTDVEAIGKGGFRCKNCGKIFTYFEVVVNTSVVETLSRCLNTSLTTIITVLAILLFVGASIQNFAVVLLIGIIAGTFSSTCIAPNLLIIWEKREWGGLFRRRPLPAKSQ